MMQRILVVNLNYLGDALMTTPAHALLRRAYPKARIDAIAGAEAPYGAFEALANNPDIDNLIPRASGGAARRCWQLWSTLVRGRYDAVVILPPIPAYDIAAALAFTPRRVFGRRAAENEHMCDAMLSTVAEFTGVQPDKPKMVLRVTDQERERASALLQPAAARGPLVAVNLGASRPQKRWPTSSFIVLVKALARAGRSAVLLGGPNASEREAAAEVIEAVGASAALDLTGKTTIRELAAVIESCAVVVSADTGAMHMAAALGTPVAALFGSTNPATVGPYGETPSRVLYKKLDCSPCENHPSCGGLFSCMSEIAPVEVQRSVDELLALAKPVPAVK